jgi:2-aminoadipate transaminase
MSKVISPGIRVAYTIAPKEIFQKMVVCKQGNDVHTNVWSQMVCNEFMTKYDFNSHLENLRQLYNKKAQLIMELMDKYLVPLGITYAPITGGMFTMCTLPKEVNMPEFCKSAVLNKVCVVPGNAFLTDETEECHTFRVNFTTPTDQQMERGIKLLAQTAKEYI